MPKIGDNRYRETLEKNRLFKRKLRAERRAAGICIHCTKPARPGKPTCVEHHERARRLAKGLPVEPRFVSGRARTIAAERIKKARLLGEVLTEFREREFDDFEQWLVSEIEAYEASANVLLVPLALAKKTRKKEK